VVAKLNLFWRLMIKPLAREPVRTALTVFSVALGVAVVLAIDLAGNAAAGSFRSSLETLSGPQTLEITATGGVPEELVGKLGALPYNWGLTARMEHYAVLAEERKTLPLIGLDLIAESGRHSLAGQSSAQTGVWPAMILQDPGRDAVWVGESLGKRPGDALRLLVNDRQ
jgi:putative ABC transport system permease protein